jgi:hypothetical protein
VKQTETDLLRLAEAVESVLKAQLEPNTLIATADAPPGVTNQSGAIVKQHAIIDWIPSGLYEEMYDGRKLIRYTMNITSVGSNWRQAVWVSGATSKVLTERQAGSGEHTHAVNPVGGYVVDRSQILFGGVEKSGPGYFFVTDSYHVEVS